MNRALELALICVVAMPSGCATPPNCGAGFVWLPRERVCAVDCSSSTRAPSQLCYATVGGVWIEGGVEDAQGVDASGADSIDVQPAADAADGATDGESMVDAVDASRMVDPSIDPPRSVAPMSTSLVTSTRPTLRWSLAVGTDRAVVEVARDRAFTVDVRRESAVGESWRVGTALASGAWFWRVRGATESREGLRSSPVWWFRVGARNADNDTSGGTALDLNGDAISDVAVGGGDRVGIYYGARGTLAATAATTLTALAPGDDFGRSVASAGDVNGDGYGDLIVGAAPPFGRTSAGYARIYLGSAMGVNTMPAATINGASATDCLGSAVAGVGDLDGDGYGDVAIGARNADGGNGAVLIFRGSATGLGATPIATLNGINGFGRSLAAAGDLNGDGFGDLVVGAFTANEASVALGRRNLAFFVVDQRLRWTDASIRTNSFGASVTGAFDANGDGYFDIAVGTGEAEVAGQSAAGVVRVYGGSAGGVLPTPIASVDGVVASTLLGATLAAGDVNGDGFGDLIIGAPEDDGVRTNAGAARVVLGDATRVGQSQYVLSTPITTGAARFGSSISAFGDLNGDGVSDVIVGVPDAMAAAAGAYGVAAIYVGGASRLATPIATLEAPASVVGYARSVAH